jgi:pectinesterase
MARDLCVENTAGPRKELGQAVALFSKSDQSVVYRCALRSYQDTLYAESERQFYRECKISGTVDFIFGDAAAVFQNCDILARLPIQGQQNTVTAEGRDKPDSKGGFCFQSCTVAADDDLAKASGVETYLGRPWKAYSRVIFMESTISNVLDAKGWLPWEHAAPPDTIYYAEYDNAGPGAAAGGRVNWSGFHAIRDAAEAINFTVEKFINGNDWLPSTGVDYKPGL